MSIQQPGQGTETAEEQPRADEEHDKDQRAAAETEVAAYDANKGSAPVRRSGPQADTTNRLR